MGLEIRKIVELTARPIGIWMLRITMDLESIVLYLNKKDLAAAETHTEINHVHFTVYPSLCILKFGHS
jgi:hypothetical protein